MGDRAQVKILPEGVYLYTHWGGTELAQTVQTALKRQDRWDDEEYLTRIIFSTMIKNEIDGDTGYGISTSQHGDISNLVIVDTGTQQVTIKTGYDKMKQVFKGSFEEFINENVSGLGVEG